MANSLLDIRRSLPAGMRAMTLAGLLGLAIGLPGNAAAAEFDHVQLNVADPAAAAAWYAKNLGGKLNPDNAVSFAAVTIRFAAAEEPVAGSVGSVIDHLGFAYPDIVAKMRELEAAGVEIVSGIKQEGPIKFAFVRDRWHTLIEIVEDAETTGFHHIHLATTDPNTTLAWYQDVLHGKRDRFGGVLPGIRFRDGWVLAKGVEEPRAPTKGRSIDHVGWSVEDVSALAGKMAASGLHVEPSKSADAPPRHVFIEAPAGVRIELVEPPK